MPTPGFTPEEELQIWKDIAARRDDEIMKLEAKLKAAAPPAKPEPPPPPAAPPPPRPASITAFHALPAAEFKRVAEFFGGAEKLDAELDAEFHYGLGMRKGVAPDDRRTTVQILQDRTVHAPIFRPGDFDPPSESSQKWRDTTARDLERGREALAALPPGHPMRAQFDALNMSIGTGRAAPARVAAPFPAPAPKGVAPTHSKTKYLGGARK